MAFETTPPIPFEGRVACGTVRTANPRRKVGQVARATNVPQELRPWPSGRALDFHSKQVGSIPTGRFRFVRRSS